MIETLARRLNHGIQYLHRFNNNYGASVILNDMSYGNKSGLWELAVVKWREQDPITHFEICYDTVITSDVLGYLDNEQVKLYLNRIKEL